MIVAPPRVRMLAGPNGSGKSTIKAQLPPELFRTFVNADEIELEMRRSGGLDLSAYGVVPGLGAVKSMLSGSGLLKRAGMVGVVDSISLGGGRITLDRSQVNSYVASALAGMVRELLRRQGASFSFETVMSSRDKIEFLGATRAAGYRNYLYYVATSDPQINIRRVRERVEQGGHDVPPDKIVSRYERSLSLLPEAIRLSDRAFIFDNSGDAAFWFAEVTSGQDVEYKAATIPDWVQRSVPGATAPSG
jgi:predicted ABC-type ATPase